MLPKVEYPTFLYISPGKHFGPPGTTYDVSPEVKSDADLEEALEAGFHLTLPQAVGLAPASPKPSELRARAAAEAAAKQKAFDEAVEAAAAKKVAALQPAPSASVEAKEEAENDLPSRVVLESQAKDLGIKPDGRWSDSRLASEIAKAKG